MRERRKWAPEEDQILRREASLQIEKGQLKQWNVVAASLPGRSNKDCRKRWAKLGSNISKGAWSTDENEKLQAAVQELGCRWTEVAKRVGTRHAEQCAKRWQNSLDPTVDHSKWGEDDEKLLSCVQLCGRNWTSIREKYFPNRSGTDLKNRYTMLIRKQRHMHESSSAKHDNDASFASKYVFEACRENNDDEAEDIMDDDDDDDDENNDEYDDDDDDENNNEDEDSSYNHDNEDNHSKPYMISSHDYVAQASHQNAIFQFRTTMPNVDSAFFSSSSNSTNNLTWDAPAHMNGQLSYGSSLTELESSSSVQPTPPSTLASVQPDTNMIDFRGCYGDLQQSETDDSWIGISNELSHTPPSTSPSQTTLVLENVHPETLKSVMYILIETNTKMTMQRHQ